MTVKILNPRVCRIEYSYSIDYTPFGEKRFQWSVLREKGRELNINHAYIIKTEAEQEEVLVNTSSGSCIICSDGDYSVDAYTEDQALDFKGVVSSDKRHSVCFNCSQSITAVSSVLGGVLLLLTEDPLPEFSSKQNIVTEIGKDLFLIDHKTEKLSFEVYDRNLFSSHGFSNLAYVSDEKFAFKNTFRGMYLHSGLKEQAQLITCTKGSAEIFVTDMRNNQKSYLNSFSVILDGSNSLYVGKGMAVGVLSLSDDTVVNRLHELPYDKKYLRRINLSICGAANKLNPDTLIMSVLDRKSEGVEINEG